MGNETFTVENDGIRLDKFLAGFLTQYSRVYIKGLIARGCVTVDGVAGKADRLLRAGSKVEVREDEPLADAAGDDFENWIIHEDNHLLVLNKPSGLLMHPLGPTWLTVPRAALSDAQPNLAAILLRNRPAIKAGRCGIVHRLDRQTSGVLLVAKTLRAQENLQEDFKQRRIDKTYRAIVRGAPKERELRIDAPIGRKPGHRRILVTPFGKAAQTGFKIIESCAAAAVLEGKPLTGRTHQIRAHAALLGHPVMGDPEHDKKGALPWPPRFMLHAYRIEFDHPATGKRVAFKADLPKDFRDFWKVCLAAKN